MTRDPRELAQRIWDFVYSEESERCTDEEEVAKIAEILAAHYEPVPDLTQSDDTLTQAVSEEQPTSPIISYNYPDEMRFKIGEAMDIAQGTIEPAPHRATIAQPEDE